MNSTLSRETALTFFVLCFRLTSQAATLVLATRALGPHAFGSYAACSAMAVVLGILPNLGAGYVMLAESAGRKEPIAAIWSYAWPTSLVTGLLLLLAYVPAAQLITPESGLKVSTLLVIGTTELVLMPIIYLASFALQASGRVPLGQLVQWLPLGLRTLAAIPCFFIPEDQRLAAFVTGQALFCLVALTAGLSITQRYVSLEWRPRAISLAQARKGAPYALMHFVAMNPSELDKVLAARLAGPGEAGIYSAANRVMAALITPVLALLLAAQPQLFQHASTPRQESRRLIRNIALIATGWGACTSVLLMLARSLLPWLFGNDYAQMTDLVPLLAVTCPLLALRMSAGSILVALGTPGQRVMLEIGGIITLACGAMFWVADYGIKGLILAVILSESVMLGAGWFSILRRLPPSDGT